MYNFLTLCEEGKAVNELHWTCRVCWGDVKARESSLILISLDGQKEVLRAAVSSLVLCEIWLMICSMWVLMAWKQMEAGIISRGEEGKEREKKEGILLIKQVCLFIQLIKD